MSEPYAWWSALVHGGCLIAPARLQQYIDDNPIPMEPWRRERLRRAQERFLSKKEKGTWIETVLEDALGHRLSDWPSATGEDWTVKSVTGESLRPRRIFDAEGHPFPLFVSENERIGLGKGRRDVARTIEWLRKKDLELALVTNGRQWRIVYAGETADAWAESSIDNWFAEGRTAPALEALRHLLNPEALRGPLRQAVLDTRKGQSELSAALGERVRQAVEQLIVACGKECDKALESGDVTLSDLYAAGVRMVMRMVVLLFAESRDLLPMTEAAYFRSYSMRNLFETLEREGRGMGGAERLRTVQAAWPRVIALCRLVHEGSPHSRLAVPVYGGELFLPGDPNGQGINRALAAIEATATCPSDLDVQRMLTLITQAPIKIAQGRGKTTVPFPVDFSQIDTEYIGILYEGLLDYELRRVATDQPQIILAIGDQPILPLRRLEGMTDAQLKELLDKMKVKGAAAEGDTEEDTDEDETIEDLEDSPDLADVPPEPVVDLADRHAVYLAALEWAKKAALAAKLVKRNAPPKDLEATAKTLIESVRAPGEYYLVRFGGTRKGSGTFYTVPALAAPTVRRTLEPLLWGEDGPREPEQILGLKVCDPACGSGSFPLAALRLINEALYESLLAHGWLVEEDGVVHRKTALRETPDWLKDALNEMPGINEPVGPIGHDERIKARLKRHVVERCLYGVDINRLAVELTRVALWIETMDPRLPFSFLDHKFKVGNAILGCWFDRFQDYPLLAWQREGGDKVHPTSVHHAAGTWTKAIADAKKTCVENLASMLRTGTLLPEYQATEVHAAAQAVYEDKLHAAVNRPEAQKGAYSELQRDPAYRTIRFAFDAWCAVWFWPAERLWLTTPTAFDLLEAVDCYSQSARDPEIAWRTNMEGIIGEVNELAVKHHFFHWELEFPDVFAGSDPGFHAVLGNPPWEIRKPNSKEWFSNHDPLYRSYGKQLALEEQRKLFRTEPHREVEWLEYNADLKSASNWVKSVGDPYGNPETSGGVALSRSRDDNRNLFRAWEQKRKTRRGHAPMPHPFISQGSADINTYKLFLEQSLCIAKADGRIGLIVPSGVYTDRGSVDLRDRFLNENQWEWLFGFENRDGIFNIHRSFKFCPVIVQKGGETERVRSAFMRRDLADWEALSPSTLPVTREQIRRFSPRSRALLEVRDARDIEILETMTANGVPLGEEGEGAWGVKYAREFDMTNDSKLFPPREQWERQGYRPDEYGHWLKGPWYEILQPPTRAEWEASRLEKAEEGTLGPLTWDVLVRGVFSEQGEREVRSRCGKFGISLDFIEDVALPLYEGRMIGQFDFSQKGWVSGKGRSAVWRDIPWDAKVIEPQYLMKSAVAYATVPTGLKLPLMNIGSATNIRTAISALAIDAPCNHSLNPLRCETEPRTAAMCGLANSFVFDYSVRMRLGGLNLSFFVLDEVPVPAPSSMAVGALSLISLQLSATDWRFAPSWEAAGAFRRWALTDCERLRLRCLLDAAVAHLYGLSQSQFAYILRDCDHPSEQVTNKAFARNLDPKGFWRVDKNQDPELRHPVLAQVAFADLKALIRTHGEERGLSLFLGTPAASTRTSRWEPVRAAAGTPEFFDEVEERMIQGLEVPTAGAKERVEAELRERFTGSPPPAPSEGWMLPEKLCLADYGLGRDDRAKHPQPVASRLGPRFYDWQLKQTPEESWAECRRHAATIQAIRSIGLPSEGEIGTGSIEGVTPGNAGETGSTKSCSSPAPKPITGNLFDPEQSKLME